MTRLEKAIIEFNGNQDSVFIDYINTCDSLNEKEKVLIKKMWDEASQFELWNYSNLNIGKKNALSYLKENYKLNIKVLKKIVNSISHEWL